jgi:hypothetical protein
MTTTMTFAAAKTRINALMMYYFTYDSLKDVPQKTLITKLEN